MKRFFRGLIAFIMIAIIIGGLGYVGYNYYFTNSNSNMGMSQNNSMNMTSDTTNNANSMQSGMSSGGMNMQGGMASGGMSMQNQQSNAMIVDTVKDILSNKQSLDNAIAALKDSLVSLTLDPYGSHTGLAANSSMGSSDSMSGMQMPMGTADKDTATAPAASTNNTNGSTTINIYPDNKNMGAAQTASAADMTMKDMGTRYDANKMEQLHSGLYKLAVGMQLLEQLDNEFLTQAEVVRTADINDPVQYYANQYTVLLQNNNKLSQALNYINEAADLVNINPYVSDNGLVYDKDRMFSIHESIFKMAKGVALLNELNNGLMRQAVNTSVKAQDAQNAAYANAMMSNGNQGSSALAGGIFSNMNLPSIINIVLIAFVIIFIIGLLGAIMSLFTAPKRNIEQ